MDYSMCKSDKIELSASYNGHAITSNL